MEMFFKVIFKIKKQMEMEYIKVLMELYIQDLGNKMYKLDMELNVGRMDQNIKDNLKMVYGTVKANMHYQMEQHIMDNGNLVN